MSSLASGIAAAPSQKVTTDQLVPMGLDKLMAMANGQIPSIAPPYIIIAAIKQLKDGKGGQQDPIAPGSVKDQLLASLQPKPMPAPPGQGGIGSLQQAPQGAGAQMAPSPQMGGSPPTQMMSGGGKVRHFDDGGTAGTAPTDPTAVKLATRDAVFDPNSYLGILAAKIKATLSGQPDPNGFLARLDASSGLGKLRDSYQNKPAAPTAPDATAAKSAPLPFDMSTPQPGLPGYTVPQINAPAAITAPPDQRGLGDPSIQQNGAVKGNTASGMKPYTPEIPAATSLDQIPFNLPDATRTQAAYEAMQQSPERLAQMKADAQNRGLAAFVAQGGKPNQSLGSLIGAGGAAYANTMADQNDKINAEQMQYKMAQAGLAQALDKFGFEKTLDTLNGKQNIQQQLWARGQVQTKENVEAQKDYNANLLKQQEISVRWGEVKAAAQQRADQQGYAYLDHINNEATRSAQVAGTQAETNFLKTLSPTDQLDPTNRSKGDLIRNTASANAYNDYMKQTKDVQNALRKRLGLPAAEF